jgi:hypothetical protein
MLNPPFKDYLLLAVLSLLMAVLVVVAFVSVHLLPYQTVVY